jgi:6,7-dimethyl-8-ribityllumazine synthase
MVAWESARWIMDLSIQKWNIAIINGILTCENEEQVNARISNTYAISWLNLITEIQKIK